MSNRRQDSPLPYSKICQIPEDDVQLQPYYQRVLRDAAVLAGQAPIRKWEYAMALRTIEGWHGQRQWAGVLETPEWQDLLVSALEICDVGGANSNFWQLLRPLTPSKVVVIDPTPPADTAPFDQAQVEWLNVGVEAVAAAAASRFDVITCLSVIEHVEEVRTFLRACYTLLKPGGLLYLTTDYWDAEGPDTAHFHWMRKRIYNADRIRRLLEDLRAIGYKSFGVADRKYHGNMVYDYSIASIALVKNGAA